MLKKYLENIQDKYLLSNDITYLIYNLIMID